MKIYTAINKPIWEKLKVMLAGIAFSREEKGIYYIKMPSKYATQLIQTGVIQETKQNEEDN